VHFSSFRQLPPEVSIVPAIFVHESSVKLRAAHAGVRNFTFETIEIAQSTIFDQFSMYLYRSCIYTVRASIPYMYFRPNRL
jgi:hypothetical protein